jgi:hypothetical protein
MPPRGFAPIVRGLPPAAVRAFGLARQTQRPQARCLVQLGLTFLEVFGHGFLTFALLLLLPKQRIGAALIRIAVLREAASFMRMGTQ